VIVSFTAGDEERVYSILQQLDMHNDANIVLIDARRDNKPSGSYA